jgi:hypothetical protein
MPGDQPNALVCPMCQQRAAQVTEELADGVEPTDLLLFSPITADMTQPNREYRRAWCPQGHGWKVPPETPLTSRSKRP